jgi:hypothetical protein
MTRPLSRCIELRALEHEQRALFWDYRKMPSEFGHLADDAEYEADRARAKRRDILLSVKLEHLVEFHGKSSERYSTSTREMEQA